MENIIENKNIQAMKNAAASFYKMALTTKEGTDNKKTIGASLAEAILVTYKENDTEALDWFKAQQKEKNPAFISAKSYVSKAHKVGEAILSGTFSKDTELSVSSLYDKVRDIEKQKEAEKLALAEKAKKDQVNALSDNQALLKTLEDQKSVDDFCNESSRMEVLQKVQEGYALIMAEQEALENEVRKNDIPHNVREILAYMQWLEVNSPDDLETILAFGQEQAQRLAA
jgi:hypothetical protein